MAENETSQEANERLDAERERARLDQIGERKMRVMPQRGRTVRVRVLHGKHHSADGVTHEAGHVIDVTNAAFIAFRDQFEPVDIEHPTHYDQENLDEESQTEALRDTPAAHLAARRVAAAGGPGTLDAPARNLAKDGVTSSSSQREMLDRHALGEADEAENRDAAAQLEREEREREFNSTAATAARPANRPEKIETSAEAEKDE